MPQILPRPVHRIGQQDPIPAQSLRLALHNLQTFLFGGIGFEVVHILEIITHPLQNRCLVCEGITPGLFVVAFIA